jgi:CubicO group peptidase (beta-lactamase class C family)
MNMCPLHTLTGERPKCRTISIVTAFAVATALLAAAPAGAQDKTAEIDKIFSWVAPDSPGCVVAVSHQGKLVVNKAYGLANVEKKLPLTTESVLDAGSVVKQFVAAATLLLVEEGKLSLTGDIRKYIPELPDYGHTITLNHLLTHTSGIRDWTGLGPLTGRQVDALTVTLRQRGLNFTPGVEFSYSNSGYVLLKEIVARRSGMSFGDFTRTRLFDRLGMKSTAYLLDGGTIDKLAFAYEKAGSAWKPDMHTVMTRGGGGALYTSARDLLTWNEALANGTLGTFVTGKLQEPATLTNGRKLGYGRGLFLDSNRGSTVIWHSGGAAGYGTFVARFPEHALSFASMCNAGEAATGGLYARRVYDLFVPATTTPAASAPAPAIEGVDVKSKAGLFFSEANGQPLRLAADGSRLRVAGGPPLETVAKDRFRNPEGSLQFMSDDRFELHFLSNDQIELKSMEGKTTRYRRAQPYAPGADDLKAFAGRYANDENKVVFEMTPANAGLTARVSWNESQSLGFVPVDRDTFQFRGMIIRFRRDNAGQVVGFDYSNPLVRNLTFTRLGGAAK